MHRAIRVFVLLMLSLAGAAVGGGGVLTVTSVEPAANALTAPKDAAVVVHFDRPLNTGSVGALSFWAFGRWSGTATGTYSFSNSDQTVTLTPDDPFSAGEQVMVVLSHDLQAFDGSFLRAAGYSFQFWVRAAPSTLEFALLDTVDTDTPSRPYGGLGSDLNGDGWLDLTTINEDTSDLRVFLNTADGSGLVDPFLTPTASTGSTPSPNEPSDFDRDGNVDVATANPGADSVSILLGNGDGTFAADQEVSVTGQPRGIAVLDVDGDGDVDLATANVTSSLINVLRNDGSGAFGNVTTFGTGSAGEWAIAAGDMNGDGILDLVVGGNPANRIYVYLSNGNGTFTLSDDESSGGSPWMVVLGDLDGDGTVDVSVANNSGSGAILLGDGAGNLGTAQIQAIDPAGVATDVGDVDGDGDLDWITASFSGDWALFLNDGDGNFTFDREFDAPAAASCSIMMDLDNDGDLDLALVDELADVVVLQENLGGGIFLDGFESGDVSRWTMATP